MATTAMFVRFGGHWQFQGYTKNPDEVTRLIRSVEDDMKLTKDNPAHLRMDNYRVIELPDCALSEES